MDEQKELLSKSMEFCQKNISRMASNSFKLKSWFLAIFTALFTFFAKSTTGNTNYTPILADLIWLLPLMVFPILDAYYLKQERMFVSIYNDFAKSINGKTNLRDPFDLKPTLKQRNNFSLLNVIFSISVGWLYFPMLSAFQGIIIFHVTNTCTWLFVSIFPIAMLIMAHLFKKKTPHQETKKN